MSTHTAIVLLAAQELGFDLAFWRGSCQDGSSCLLA